MSVKALVGATIGFFVGGPTGARIGWTIGSFLDAPEGQDTQAPRLDSLTAEALDYGAPIPIVYGRARLAGFRLWQRAIREQTHTEEVGGKGGGGGATNTTYSYYGTFAVGLCEGEIAGIRKIWADSTLIYNGGEDSDIETIFASNSSQPLFTIYPGSSTQEPNSLIQATQGAANTPAYRHLAYIVFDDLLLEKYGNRIPNITCEVITESADITPSKLGEYKLLSNEGYQGGNSSYYMSHDGVMTIFASTTGVNVPGDVEVYDVTASGDIIYKGVSFNRLSGTIFLDGWADVPCVAYGSAGGTVYVRDDNGYITNEFYDTGVMENNKTAQYYQRNGKHWLLIEGDTNSKIYSLTSYLPPIEVSYTSQADARGAYHTMFVGENYIYAYLSKKFLVCYDMDMTEIWAVDMSASGIGDVTPFVGGADAVIREKDDGEVILKWARYYWVVNENGYTSIGELGTELSYEEHGGHHYINGLFYYYRGQQNEIDVLYLSPGENANTVTLSDIVSDICYRSGLEASDIDVTDLTDEIDGYIISRNMSARSAIEPLQKAYFFDGAEFGNKINFVKRGSSSIKTITQDDLGATDYGSDQYALKQTRMQNSELPSDVSIGYISSVRDYEVATQRAQRINYSVPNSVGQELAIVMSDDKALQIADITLYNAYTEREKFEFALTNDHIDLNPTDVVTVTYEGDSRVVRLVKLSYGDVIECEAISEDSQVYTSTATAAPDTWSGQTISLPGNTYVAYRDIPMLRNADNDAGLYFAAAGYKASWTGAQIFKSVDGGTTYSPITAIFASGTAGSAIDALPDAVSTLWDRTNTLTISLVTGSLSSATEDNVIKGTNYLLVGSEIIQFANATLNGDGTYTVDTLIRGRRGTEWATTEHEVGEGVILLTESTIRRFEATLNTAVKYKAVTLGQYVENAVAETVTNTGISLKPFSPAYVRGSRDGSNNLTVTWMRRSRYIGGPLWELPVFEESESYEVDVMSGATVLRTISASSETASYSAAEQTADGLTPGDPVTINVYQLSATAGRGYGTEATI